MDYIKRENYFSFHLNFIYIINLKSIASDLCHPKHVEELELSFSVWPYVIYAAYIIKFYFSVNNMCIFKAGRMNLWDISGSLFLPREKETKISWKKTKADRVMGSEWPKNRKAVKWKFPNKLCLLKWQCSLATEVFNFVLMAFFLGQLVNLKVPTYTLSPDAPSAN